MSNPFAGAFGELRVSQMHREYALTAMYDQLNPQTAETRTTSDGSVTMDSARFKLALTSTAAAGSYAVLRSVHRIHYEPGQGVCARGTAVFHPATAGVAQLAGIGNSTNGLYLGYGISGGGSVFGIERHHSGRHRMVQFIVTGAVTVNGTISFTIAATASTTSTYNVAVTTTICTSAAATAYFIAKTINASSTRAHDVDVVSNTLIFRSQNLFNRTYADSVNAGGTGPSFVASTLATGATNQYEWVPQSSWNVDKMDGTGPSGANLDLTKSIIFQMQYQWLGFGGFTVFLEDPQTTRFVPVHRFAQANSASTVTWELPHFTALYALYNLTSGALAEDAAVVMYTSSSGGFIDGPRERSVPRFAGSVQWTSSDTTETAVAMLEPRLVVNGIWPNNSVIIPKLLTVTEVDNGNNAYAYVRLYKNVTPALTTAGNSNVAVNTYSTATINTTPGCFTFASAINIVTFAIASKGQQVIDLTPLELSIDALTNLGVTVQRQNSSGSSNVTLVMALSWSEAV